VYGGQGITGAVGTGTGLYGGTVTGDSGGAVTVIIHGRASKSATCFSNVTIRASNSAFVTLVAFLSFFGFALILFIAHPLNCQCRPF
jgi:hypothetical protein